MRGKITTEQAQRIEQRASQWMARHRPPSVSVALVLDGRLAWEQAFGYADVEQKIPATPATVYRRASIAKSMTATAIMQLVEQGRLDLDAPVQKYCPAYPRKPWPITARLLLAHLAGVRHYTAWESLFPSTNHYPSVAASLDIFKNDELVSEPGTQYNYSTYGYSILGCAIEGASGTTYAAYMREHIFVPAGMTQTEPDDARKTIAGRAQLYSKGRVYRIIKKFPASRPRRRSIPATALLAAVSSRRRTIWPISPSHSRTERWRARSQSI